MNKNQRPHSRDKKVGSGTAGVGRGREVNTGKRPVGTGGRGDANRGKRASGALPTSLPVKLNLKTILILAAAIIIALFLLKACGGGDILSGILGGGEYIDDYSDAGSEGYGNDDQASSGGADLTVSSLARDKRVIPVGGGKDVVTIMVYMCGTDLESKYGMATKDLQEMMKADISDKVNLIVETGGCNKWQNNVISNAKNQIYKVESGGLKVIEKDVGTSAMTDPNNLTNFIDWCEENYPADRNILIFWDHGGGSLSGYGYDEKKPNSSSMTLAKINTALKDADCTFDFIGFDACLMATLETALVCNTYADYLLASEETEPGTGWYYTDWLTELSDNTSTSTVNIAQTIIDTFVSSSKAASPNAKVTLSVVDLAELQGTVPDAFRDFSVSTTEMLKSDDYKAVSNARAGVRQFSKENKLNQVDLVDLADRIGTKESKALSKALKGCVKYNKSTMTNCYGISIYFPYETTSSVKSAVASYEALGMDDEYTECIKSFASLEYGGQIAASASQMPNTSSGGTDLLGSLLTTFAGGGSSTSPLDVLLGSFTGSSGSSSAGMSIDPSTLVSLLGAFSGRSMPAEYDWVDTELVADHADDIVNDYLDPSHITVTDKNGKNVLRLTDSEWDLVQTIELNVFVEDGDGYIDLGLDNTFEWDGDDLLLDYDGTWLTLNGHVCAYYLVSDTEQDDGSWTTIGRIPALLNGELVNLQVVFDKANPDGAITGAFPMYEDGETDVQAKGNIEVVTGDSIELLCDYYDLDGGYSSSYTLGDKFTVPNGGLELYNLALDAENFSVTYRLTDIYGNHFWTPVTD